MQNMMVINTNQLQWFIFFFYKNNFCHGKWQISVLKDLATQELAEKLHKIVTTKFEKRKVL